MAKFCLFYETPRYDNRDAIVGTRVARGRCFTKVRAAKKALRRELTNAHDELNVVLCPTANYCGRQWTPSAGPVPYRKRSARGLTPTRNNRRKPTTAKQRRAKRRERLHPDYIPF